MASFLLELFSEEIPARMQLNAAHDLKTMLGEELKKAGIVLDSGQFKNYVTPRRVAVIIDGLPLVKEDKKVEKKGPKTSAPQAAIDGFLRASGLPLEKLEKRMIGKDETYFAVMEEKGGKTEDVLKDIIKKILADFPWPKSMRWGSGEARWVRPLHSIIAIFDGKKLDFAFAGIKASNVTYGHRFLAPAAISILSSEEYVGKLKDAKVIVGHEERKAEILKQAEAVAAKAGLQVKRDDGLLTEVTGLVEWPTVLMGRIDDAFMDLPPEVLISEMRAHQKYFSLQTKDGEFANKFLIVSNMLASDEGKAIIAGNERVLRARLSDGRFFYDQDRKKKLDDWAEGLKSVTFHAKIGTIAEKVKRIELLASALADNVKGADKKLVARAAQLCKADLTTGMVGEFPELQGVMGRYYALAQKEDASVADAIRDHYLPLGPDSPVPTAPVSICVALADKLDTLISMFAAGEKPTGSKDPFALRRSALGIIRIILTGNIRLSLKTFLTEELIAFFNDRLKVSLKEEGIRHDVINAVIANGDDDLVRVVERAKAVQAFLGTEDGTNLLAAYKRANNIVSIEEKKDNIKYAASDLDAAILKEPEEIGLIFLRNPKEIERIERLIKNEQFFDFMKWLATLREPIDRFFDKILVNDRTKGDDIRANRLCLLATIKGSMDYIADFSLIEG